MATLSWVLALMLLLVATVSSLGTGLEGGLFAAVVELLVCMLVLVFWRDRVVFVAVLRELMEGVCLTRLTFPRRMTGSNEIARDLGV